MQSATRTPPVRSVIGVQAKHPDATALPPQDQTVPADCVRDELLQVDPAERAGGATDDRNSDRLIAIDPDPESEDVSEEKQALDSVAALEADERCEHPR